MGGGNNLSSGLPGDTLNRGHCVSVYKTSTKRVMNATDGSNSPVGPLYLPAPSLLFRISSNDGVPGPVVDGEPVTLALQGRGHCTGKDASDSTHLDVTNQTRLYPSLQLVAKWSEVELSEECVGWGGSGSLSSAEGERCERAGWVGWRWSLLAQIKTALYFIKPQNKRMCDSAHVHLS